MIGEIRRNVVKRSKIGGICVAVRALSHPPVSRRGSEKCRKMVGNAHLTSHSIATIRSKLDVITLWAVSGETYLVSV